MYQMCAVVSSQALVSRMQDKFEGRSTGLARVKILPASALLQLQTQEQLATKKANEADSGLSLIHI